MGLRGVWTGMSLFHSWSGEQGISLDTTAASILSGSFDGFVQNNFGL